MNILRVTLLRSVGLWMFPLFLAVVAVALVSYLPQATFTWNWAGSSVAGCTILLGPVAAGVAAADSVSWNGVRPLSETRFPRSPAWHAARTLAVAAWPCCALLLGYGTAWIWTALRHSAIGGFDPLLIGASCSAVVAHAAVGSALGWWWPSRFAIPMVATATYFLFLVLDSRLLMVGGATEPLIGMRYRPDVLALQTCWFFVVGAVMITALWVGTRSSGVALGALAASVLGGALVVSGIVGDGRDPLVVQEGPPPISCTGQEVRVCVPTEVRQILPEYAATAGVVARTANTLVGPNRRVVTVHGGPETGSDGRIVRAPISVAPPYARAQSIARSIVASLAGCRGDELLGRPPGPAVRYLLSEAGAEGAEAPPGSSAVSRSAATSDLARLSATCRGAS